MTRDKGAPEKPEAGGFTSRWSRMKQSARSEAEAEPDTPPERETDSAEDERSDDEVLADLGLPDPEALKPGDDFSAFMARTVPARIRNRALRRLWLSNPLLSAIDEMVEYGEDYTDAATVIENLQTAYQVGRGFADKVREAAGSEPEGERVDQESTGGEAVTDDPEAGTASDPAEAEAGAGTVPDAIAHSSPGHVEAVEIEVAEAVSRPATAPAPRRRMRFRLAED